MFFLSYSNREANFLLNRKHAFAFQLRAMNNFLFSQTASVGLFANASRSERFLRGGPQSAAIYKGHVLG